jgi:hypothetical protein
MLEEEKRERALLKGGVSAIFFKIFKIDSYVFQMTPKNS